MLSPEQLIPEERIMEDGSIGYFYNIQQIEHFRDVALQHTYADRARVRRSVFESEHSVDGDRKRGTGRKYT